MKACYQTCRTCDGLGCGCPMCGDKGKILLGFVSSKVLKAWEAGLMGKQEIEEAIDDGHAGASTINATLRRIAGHNPP